MPETIKRLFRPGGVLNLALGFIALGAFLTAGVLTLPRVASTVRPSIPPTAHEVAVALSRIGLDTASLTAIGLTQNQVSGIVADGKASLVESIDDLREADGAWAEARREADRLEALIQAGGAGGEDVQDYTAAKATLATATAARQAILDSLFEDATADLTEQPIAKLQTIHANRSAGWDLPIEYLTLTRTQAEWVQLRESLANVRIAGKLGEEPDGACSTLVTMVNAVGSVASAKASLDANLAANTTAWKSAVNG